MNQGLDPRPPTAFAINPLSPFLGPQLGPIDHPSLHLASITQLSAVKFLVGFCRRRFIINASDEHKSSGAEVMGRLLGEGLGLGTRRFPEPAEAKALERAGALFPRLFILFPSQFWEFVMLSL